MTRSRRGSSLVLLVGASSSQQPARTRLIDASSQSGIGLIRWMATPYEVGGGFVLAGPLRLLRRHLPLKGEDCENGDVLTIQGPEGGVSENGDVLTIQGPEGGVL